MPPTTPVPNRVQQMQNPTPAESGSKMWIYIVCVVVIVLLLGVLLFVAKDSIMGIFNMNSSTSSSENSSVSSVTSSLSSSSTSSVASSVTSSITSSTSSSVTTSAGTSNGELTGTWSLLSETDSSKEGIDGIVKTGPYCQLAGESLGLTTCVSADDQYKVAPNVSLQVLSKNTGAKVLAFKTNANGQFKLNLSVSKFLLRTVDATDTKVAGIEDFLVNVVSGKRENVQLVLKI